MTKMEKDRVIQTDIIKLGDERTPSRLWELLFLGIMEDGFIIRPVYIDTHLSHVLCGVIGKF